MNLQFQAMDEYDQFVLISRTHVVSKRGKPCDPYDPANHLSGSVAQRIARRKGYVRGFAIMRSDPFFVIHVENYRRSAQDLAEIGPRFPEVLIRRSAGSGEMTIIGHDPIQRRVAEEMIYPGITVHTEDIVIPRHVPHRDDPAWTHEWDFLPR